MPDKETGAPAPEVLKPKEEGSTEAAKEQQAAQAQAPKKPRRGTYRPSHKATFIGLIVVVAILAVNAGIIAFVVIKGQSKPKQIPDAQINLSQSTLSQLGVSRNAVRDAGVELVVNPDAKFGGNVQVGGDISVAGQLTLNSNFRASSANLTQLEAGKTSLAELNVNGDGTFSNLSLRGNLAVAGTTQLQGAVTLSPLLTVNGSATVTNNLSVGGTLAVGAFQANNLIIAGHVTTLGLAPSVSRGGAVGTNGTVSVSGNDAAGTVAANTGVGAGTGLIACVTFRNAYSTVPHVVISQSGPVDAYVSRSASGFCIYAGNTMSVGAGYAFDYIVEQ